MPLRPLAGVRFGDKSLRCPAEWLHVAEAVIVACTSVTKWSTIGFSKHCNRDGGEHMAARLAFLRGEA